MFYSKKVKLCCLISRDKKKTSIRRFRQVNGITISGRSPDEVVQILSSLDGTITFKLVPAYKDPTDARESAVRMKVQCKFDSFVNKFGASKSFNHFFRSIQTYFSYNPKDDKVIPCKEAGLEFQKGDILHIVDMEDRNWWQAKKEGDPSNRAGKSQARDSRDKICLNKFN